MAKRPKGRAVSGVLLLNKSAGMSSNQALQKARRLFDAAKAGHTGNLDPLATGVLPLCFGEATKFSQFLLDADKRYRATICLGQRTTSGDADGDLIEERDASDIDRAQVESALKNFVGAIEQVPSMFSAIKHQGQPLYKLARQGKEVERQARRVTVYSLDLLGFRPGKTAEADIEVFCSKGTYIRTIAEDLGQVLGCGGHITVLHRAQSGPFHEKDALSLSQLQNERGDADAQVLDRFLLPADAPAGALAGVQIAEHSAFYFRQGQAVMEPGIYKQAEVGDLVRVFAGAGDFLGVGEITDDGRVAPKRLVVTQM